MRDRQRFHALTSPRTRRAALCAAALTTLLPLAAQASDRWEEAAGGAVAVLPVPAKAKGILGGSLACAEQRWSLRLRADPASAAELGEEAVMTIQDERIPAKVEHAGSIVTLPVPFEALDGLKDGTRFIVAFGTGRDALGATFSLRGSKKVIEAIAPRCSPIDMSGYERIDLAASGPAMDVVRPLMAEELALFEEATDNEPSMSAAILELPYQRALAFGQLCGSTWYYGATGCTVAAFVRQSAGSDWAPVYSSEGVAIHTDPRASSGGLPNLVTLPLVNGLEATHWTWSGTAYEPLGETMTAQQSDPADDSEGDAGSP